MKPTAKHIEKPNVTKSEKKGFCLSQLIGVVIGLLVGIGLTIVASCYAMGWVGYVIALVVIAASTWVGYWAGLHHGIQLFFEEDVYYRLFGYSIFGLLLFLVTWAVFTFLIKAPSLMADSFIVQKFFKPEVIYSYGNFGIKHFGNTIFGHVKTGEFFLVWCNTLILTLLYFLNHLPFVILFALIFNHVKVGRWNLGIIFLGAYTILWGIVMGTNSTSFPVGNNALFGSLLLFVRYGLVTWIAYLMLVASTTQFAWLVSPSWLAWGWKMERKLWPVSFTPEQREVFIFGLMFLLAAGFAEARIFVHYNIQLPGYPN